MIFSKLANAWLNRATYSEQEQEIFVSLKAEAGALEALEGMKATDGWKLLNTKMREELHNLILEATKSNPKIQTLLDILSTVETKQASTLLAEEIDRVIPN
jgi:hypothetical protein